MASPASGLITRSFLELPVIGAAGIWAPGGLNLDGGGEGVRLAAAVVDDGFFTVMAVDPVIGSVLPKPDGASRFAVLSYDLWRARFNADRAILGQTISLNRQTYVVTGVMPPGFSFPGRTDAWIPPGADNQITGAAFGPEVVVRLAPGASMDQARHAIAAYDLARRPAGASSGNEMQIRPDR